MWSEIEDIIKNLVSHGPVLDILDLDFILKETKESHILTVNIKLLSMNLWKRQR